MGDNFLEDQTEKCRKRRDRAMAEVQHPTLLDRPEVIRRLFDIKPRAGESFQPGEMLLAQITDRSGPVSVLRGTQTIGTVDGEGGKVLGNALDHTCGATRMRIVSVLSLSGVGRAEIVEGER